METFAESGAWRADSVTRCLTRMVEKAPRRIWHGFRVSAVDDIKVHRNSGASGAPAPSTSTPARAPTGYHSASP